MSLKSFCSTPRRYLQLPDAAGLLQVRLPERCVCGQSLGEVRVPHRGNVVEKLLKGLTRWWACLTGLRKSGGHAVADSAATGTPGTGTGGLTYRYGDEHQPVTTADILTPDAGRITVRTCGVLIRPFRRNAERRNFRSQCQRETYPHPCIHSIDTDIKLNRALWVMAETCWRACADTVSLKAQS